MNAIDTNFQPKPISRVREDMLNQPWGALLHSLGYEVLETESACRRLARSFVKAMEGASTLTAWQCIAAADRLRETQRAYVSDRGNEAKGQAVAEAAQEYDDLRSKLAEQMRIATDRPSLPDTLGLEYNTTIDAMTITGPDGQIYATASQSTPVSMFAMFAAAPAMFAAVRKLTQNIAREQEADVTDPTAFDNLDLRDVIRAQNFLRSMIG